MFTHRNNEKDNERGALMIEAIALLGLMTMMSPMVVRQTADRTAEMEEVAIAGQMKEIKDALSNWIEANYQEKAKEFSAGNKVDESFAVSAADLAPYLPATYLNGNQFRGNKLVDGFDVGVRAQCTEVSKDDGTECTAANNCYELDGGAVKAIPAGAKCSRYKMTGVVLSKSDNNEEIDDRRASRIASMIGADGGYMRTKKLVESLYGSSSGGSGSNPDGAVPEMQKIVGSQGMWEGDVTKYIPGVSTNIGGKVAATTIFSSGFSGDYLYRKKVDGLPGANSMFTDLDMGGATECEGDGCHKINNAGGLEVVGGKILIRSQNTNDDQGISSGDAFAKIALATDNSHMHVADSIDLSVGASISGNSVSDASGRIQMSQYNGISMETKGDMFISGNHFEAHIDDGAYAEQYIRGDQTKLSVGNNSAFSFLSSDKAKTSVDDGTSFSLLTKDTADLSINNRESYLAMDNMGISIDTLKNAQITANVLKASIGDINGADRNSPYTWLTMSENETKLHISTEQTEAYSFLNESKSETIVDTESSFTLYSDPSSEEKYFSVNLGTDDGDMPVYQMLFNKMGLTLHSNRDENRITFTTKNSSTGATEGMVNLLASKDGTGLSSGKRGAALVVEDGGKKQIAFYGDSGRISGVFFQPEALSVDGAGGGIIQGRGAITIANNGQTTADSDSLINRISSNKYTAAVAINMYMDNSYIHPYESHRYDNRYNFFRVDPAFMSVMNDIKITSRGGARLSEALPNYILKGIYELSNSYGAGGWPCSRGTEGKGNCSFNVPYYSKKALGLSSGGWEFNCGEEDNGTDRSHPITAGGGKCKGLKDDLGSKKYDDLTDSEKTVTFSYDRNESGATYDYNEYYECPDNTFCWAHPFLGMVPAPGRWVQYNVSRWVNVTGKEKEKEILYAQDEGVCPDGYQAVITVTPTVFELGKVSFVNSNKKPSDASVAYNPGWQNYTNANIADVTGIMQQATKLGLIVDQIKIGTTNHLAGWRVAMGTVTPVSTDINSDRYIWNAGGIPANSWSAIAHTYCYFNPARFNMPNMRFMKLDDKGGFLSEALDGETDVILTPMDNPMADWDEMK